MVIFLYNTICLNTSACTVCFIKRNLFNSEKTTPHFFSSLQTSILSKATNYQKKTIGYPFSAPSSSFRSWPQWFYRSCPAADREPWYSFVPDTERVRYPQGQAVSPSRSR